MPYSKGEPRKECRVLSLLSLPPYFSLECIISIISRIENDIKKYFSKVPNTKRRFCIQQEKN